jgi:aminopeptidase N
VQTGYCAGSAEYPCLSFLSEQLVDEEKTRAIARETANQWWGVAVANNQAEQAWLDEGVSEYTALSFFEKYRGYGVSLEDAVAHALREYRSFYDVYGSVLGRTDTRMQRSLVEFANEYEYTCLIYHKSVIMLNTLRKSVGDKKFLQGLKKYYVTYRQEIVDSEHFIGSFEKVNLDVRGFFDSFLQGKAVL